MKKIPLRSSVLFFSLFLTACTAATPVSPSIGSFQPTSLQVTEIYTPQTQDGTPNPFPTNVRIEDNTEYIIPEMLGFDGIPPIYTPRFVSAQEAPLIDDELVMGVVIDGDARAYPVTVMRFREIVNDEIGGWPVLVTW